MQDLGLPAGIDQYKASRIAQLRALGYGQEEIAKTVGVSQGTVSRYLSSVNTASKKSGNPEAFLVALIAIAAAGALAAYLLRARR